MPAKSKSQQRLFGMVHAYQKGKLRDAPESVKEIARSISDEDAEHFAKTKHKGLPEKKAYPNLEKSASSRLRYLLNTGKLRPEIISRLRSLGMLPSRSQYAAGFKQGVQERLQKAFNRATNANLTLSVTNVPRGAASSSFRITRGDGRLDPFYGSSYTLTLPDTLRHTHIAGANFDTSKMPLHDAVTALHEIMEHRSLFRGGGPAAHAHPIARYVTNLSHEPGVISGERRAYDTLVRQMGGTRPNWRKYRLAGNSLQSSRRGQYPEEVVRSKFTRRDERDLNKLLDEMESVRIPRNAGIRGTYGSAVATPELNGLLRTPFFTEYAIPTASQLAVKMHKPKLKKYFDAYNKTIKGKLGGSIPSSNAQMLQEPYLWRTSNPRSTWEEYISRGRGA